MKNVKHLVWYSSIHIHIMLCAAIAFNINQCVNNINQPCVNNVIQCVNSNIQNTNSNPKYRITPSIGGIQTVTPTSFNSVIIKSGNAFLFQL